MLFHSLLKISLLNEPLSLRTEINGYSIIFSSAQRFLRCYGIKFEVRENLQIPGESSWSGKFVTVIDFAPSLSVQKQKPRNVLEFTLQNLEKSGNCFEKISENPVHNIGASFKWKRTYCRKLSFEGPIGEGWFEEVLKCSESKSNLIIHSVGYLWYCSHEFSS